MHAPSRQAVSPSPDEQPTPPQHWFSPITAGGAIRVPTNLLYILAGIFFITVIIAWLGGAASGRSEAEREANKILRRDIGVPSDPLDQPGTQPQPPTRPAIDPESATLPAGPGQPRSVPAAQPSEVAAPLTPRPSGPPPAGATITARGYLGGDPRESGKNYLALATLNAEDAAAAVEFLAANGVEAVGVPTQAAVDRKGGGANNPGPTQAYRLFAMPGITSEQYARKMTVRTNLEAKVAALGKAWQDKHRGASNFARTNWEKFQ